MYNILIVDDEKIIVDVLYEVLQDFAELEFSVFRAYSGKEALSWLEKTRIDIVVSDVCMPDINGMQLQSIILGRWPRCKVIFLSGYDNFEYARTAMRNNGIDYIIKTDGHEAVIEAIYKAIGMIQRETENESLIIEAQREIMVSLPVLQNEFILELINGERLEKSELSARFKELCIDLEASVPTLMLAGNVDNWDGKRYADKKLDICRTQSIVRENLKSAFHLATAAGLSCKPVWLLQPIEHTDDRDWDRSVITLHNTLDMIQSACRNLAGIQLSFAFSSKPCGWWDIGKKYDELRSMFFNRTYGIGKEMILNDTISDGKPSAVQNERYDAMLFAVRQELNQAQYLQRCLEEYQKEEFFAVLTRFMNAVKSFQDMPHGIRAELYYTIVLMLQSCVNRLGVAGEVEEAAELDKALHMETYGSWMEMEAFFIRLATAVFNLRENGNHNRTRAVINKIQNYVVNNLDKDLSIVTLADLAHLNQSYLSRLFKQASGVSISGYILKVKVDKACELLKKSEYNVNEIASMLGFSSHACFTRFFKRYTGVSPQDYKRELKMS